jgi:hypothetical protein
MTHSAIASAAADAAELKAKRLAAPAAAPVAVITPAVFTTPQAAAYLGVSEARFHELRPEPWMCAPIALSQRMLRWSRADLDAAIAAMPRLSKTPAEPTWLANARSERAKVPGTAS